MFSQRFIELTVPWEEVIPAAEFKRLKYSDLAAECRDRGLNRNHPSRRMTLQLIQRCSLETKSVSKLFFFYI